MPPTLHPEYIKAVNGVVEILRTASTWNEYYSVISFLKGGLHLIRLGKRLKFISSSPPPPPDFSRGELNEPLPKYHPDVNEILLNYAVTGANFERNDMTHSIIDPLKVLKAAVEILLFIKNYSAPPSRLISS